MATEIIPPFRVFTDVDGEPLEDGFIFIGAANQNPEAVPISLFWDIGLSIPAAQPIRTLGGYPSRNGTPSRFFVAEFDYSISVKNKNSTIVYSALSSQSALSDVVNSVAELRTVAGSSVMPLAYLLGFTAGVPGLGGGFLYWDATSVAADDNISIFQVTGVVTGRWIRATPTYNGLRTTGYGEVIIGDNTVGGAGVRDAINVARTINGLTDCHAFADKTVIASISDSGTYGVFDATTEYTAPGTINHLYAFQSRGKYSGSGQLDNYAGFYHQPTINGPGATVDFHGVRILDPLGTGPITNHHGVHIPALTRGANNFAIFSWGSTPSIHVGKMTFGTSVLNTTSAISVEQITTMTGTSQFGVKSDCGGNSSATVAYAAFSARVQYATGSYTSALGAGLQVDDANLGAGVTLTAQHGVHIKDQTKGATNSAIKSDVSAGTDKYGLLFTGTAQNYLQGNLGIGISTPNAKLHLAAGTAAAGTGPIQMTAGTNLTTPVNGTFEFDGTNLFFTVGGVRKTVTLT